MAERERELDALLAELVATKPEPRSESSERARRLRLTALIEEQIARGGERVPRRSGRAAVLRYGWPLSAAALVAVAFGAARWHREPPVSLEPERLGAARVEPRAPAVAPPPARSPQPEERRASEPARRLRHPSAARTEPSGTGSVPVPAEAPPSSPASSAESPLAAQNELFQSAVRSQRRGDDETALAQFDALLARFPESPLAADARVRKFRTLARLGRSAEARTAASEYLAQHPGGFAKLEAEQLLKEGPREVPPSHE